MDGDFALEDISHANIVLIFGCSIGLTDKRWWEAVVDWMKGSSARFVVIASYRLEQHRKTARSFRDFTLGLKERLFKSADRADDEEKESLFDRIFIISSSSIFNFKDTTG